MLPSREPGRQSVLKRSRASCCPSGSAPNTRGCTWHAGRDGSATAGWLRATAFSDQADVSPMARLPHFDLDQCVPGHRGLMPLRLRPRWPTMEERMIKQAVYGVAGMLCALLAAPWANAQNPVIHQVCIMAGNATKSMTVMPPNSTLADCQSLAATYEQLPPMPILGTDYSLACLAVHQGGVAVIITKPLPVNEAASSSDFTGGSHQELVDCSKMWGLAQ
jgi:hypothetical protein